MPQTKPKPAEEPQSLPAIQTQKYDATWWNPTSFPEAVEMADMMAKSDMVPKDFKGKPANIAVAWQFGAALGLNILSSLQNISIINGRPSVWGDAPLAICKTHHAWGNISEEFHGEEGSDDFRAICVVNRQGEPECRRVFSVTDAKRAGLWGKNVWASYPKRMLQMRARSWALRDTFPDALQGMGIGEEERDKNITAETTVTTEPVGGTATEKLKNKLRPKIDDQNQLAVEEVPDEAFEQEPEPKTKKKRKAKAKKDNNIELKTEKFADSEIVMEPEKVEEVPEDGMGGEEPEKTPETFEDHIAKCANSEDLQNLNELVHKRLLAGDIDNARQMELMSLLHTRAQAIAKGE